MRKTALCVTVAATVTAMLIALLPGAAQASPWVHIFLEYRSAGTCVAIPDSSDGAVPTHDPCMDIGNQLWTFEDTAVANRYFLRNTATGKCLATNGFSDVWQLPCVDLTSQQWTLVGKGHTYRVVNFSTGKCLARQNINGIVLGSCLATVADWDLLY